MGSHITFNYHISLGSAWLWMFLRLYILMTFTILGHIDKVLCTMSQYWPIWNLSDVVLMKRLKLWVWGKKMEELNFHLHHISRVHTNNMIWPLTLTLIDLGKLWTKGIFLEYIPATSKRAEGKQSFREEIMISIFGVFIFIWLGGIQVNILRRLWGTSSGVTGGLG